MPPILRTAPRSPDLVRNECSSQKPNRLIWAANDPASSQSLVMLLVLNTVAPDRDGGAIPLHGVVASAKLGTVEQHAKNFYVMLGGDAGDDGAHNEEANAAKQRMK